ncbi:MAG: lamin tail domain-containing protein [Bacteroidales bacterium]|nr:lamin tail domain-containing protein [Bacteroidales bacterium]
MIILANLLVLAVAACGMHEDPNDLPSSASPLYISEYMCAERWVEIHNPADTVVNLGGYILVAGGKELACQAVEIQPDGYLLLSSLQEMDDDDPIYLKDGAGALVDLIDTPKHKKSKSTIRRPLADGSFYQENTDIWTPGFSNDEAGHKAYQASRRTGNTSGVVISEIMADNESVYTDGEGNFVDFVELYNSSDKTVDISGWGLSDNENYPHLYRFPDGTKIKAGKYFVVNCAKDVKDCAPFNINNGADCIYLSDADGKIMAEVGPAGMLEDQSMAFSPDGKSFITTFNISPGYPNSAEGSSLYFRKVQPASLPYVGIWEALPGEEGKPGWVEIRNNSNKEVDLKGFTLTDDSPGEHSYTFPEKRLAPGALLLVNAGDEAGFEFRKSAALLLRSAKRDLLDQITLGDIPAGMSRGREDGPAWVFFATPTPGTANGTGVHGRMMAPIASIPSGQYDDVHSISVELLADGDIYYTSDGSTPTTR